MPNPPDDALLLRQLERIVVASVGVTARVMNEVANDLTLAQWRVLVVVGQRRAAPVGTIAAALGAKMPALSRLLGRLRERGLVETARAPEDARIVLVTLTDKGRRMTNRIIRSRRARFRQAILAIDEIATSAGHADGVELIAAVLERTQ